MGKQYADVDHPSSVAGAALGEPDICANKITGLLHRRLQTKVGKELLGTAKGVEIANFTDPSDGAEETNSWNGLEQMNLLYEGFFVRVCFENLFDLGQQLAGLLVQRTDHTDKVADEIEAAVHTVPKAGGILCCYNQLVTGLLRRYAAASGGGGNHGNQLIPVR